MVGGEHGQRSGYGLAENDGDVGRFRRWYKQFYSTDLGIDRF